jgi:ActR/RegA family two-component response regulator
VGAGSIAEAVSCLEAATPTEILLDLNLSDGPGTEILRQIRERGLRIRVALITGTTHALLAEARDWGVDVAFLKPPDWDKVVQWVSETPS